jgi:hypothetical protein
MAAKKPAAAAAAVPVITFEAKSWAWIPHP